MSTVSKKMEPSEIAALYKRLKPFATKEAKPQYTLWQLKTSEMVVTAYQSGKVVFQGADLSWLEDEKPLSSQADSKKASVPASVRSLGKTFPQAGSDEVGTGDYFGPLIVAAVIVPDEKMAAKLEAMQVTDSKQMTDEVIRKVAPEIAKLVPNSVQVLDNPRYNQIYDHDTMNQNRIKARMHNQAYLNLQKKGYELPKLKVVDQFVQPKGYFNHLVGVPQVVRDLHFETKAESHYVAVAAASVLARYAFLKYMDALEAKYDMPIAKGGGDLATKSGRQFKERYGDKELKNAVKLHFINTQKL